MIQEDLFSQPSQDHPDLAALINLLQGRRDWQTAERLLICLGRPVNENEKRNLRLLASQSQGRVASGQKGYKLVKEMTAEEYHHFRNAMKSQADAMTKRILESDQIFYARQPVQTGHGILNPSIQ